VIVSKFVSNCFDCAQKRAQSTTISPTNSVDSQLSDGATSASSGPSPYIISELETMLYYYGISPSPPSLVYRTGGLKMPWSLGPESNPRPKQVCGVFGHKLNTVWDEMGFKVRDGLNAQRIDWSSIDVARFITDEDGDQKIEGPVVIWVGVYPGSLQDEEAIISAKTILELLAKYDIDDVEVEYRESIYRRSVGPALLRPASKVNATVDVRSPLTPTLGLSIAASDRPHAQGTMALFFAEGGKSKKILGLTCHHVLFKTDAQTNNSYVFAGLGAPCRYVQLLGTRAYKGLLASIEDKAVHHARAAEACTQRITWLEERVGGDEEMIEDLSQTRAELVKTKKTIDGLEVFYAQVKKDWESPEQRIIGHIRYSSAITYNTDPGGFTEDWGAFELDGSKFRASFEGNVLDLGMFPSIHLSPGFEI
jgi:hypothetical protein